MPDTRGPEQWAGRVATTPVLAGVALAGAYVLLSLAMSTGGYLGTDTGAKVATLDVMVEHGEWRPGLGYWAEELDPKGRVHPVFDAQRVEGEWVHVTTLPMLLAGRPLYELGGYRLALLLPILGAVGAAFACRSIARRAAVTTSDGVGWIAFWVVGLASPIGIYALDFWEHAPGVACLLGGIAILAGVVDGERRATWALGSGALFGLGATMRTESFVYALVAVGLACSALLWRRRSLTAPLVAGALSVAGFAVPWLGNALLEGAAGGKARGQRVAGAAGSTGITQLADRGREALTTLLAARPADGAELTGALFVGLVVCAVVASRRSDERTTRVLLVLAGALQVATLLTGLNFVPGMLVAAPVAIIGLAWWPGGDRVGARYALVVAVVALPVVWLFQYRGGAGPQWAGRYALTSCLVLVAVGVAALCASGSRVLRLGVVGLACLVTLSGLLWLSERSHAVDDYFDMLVHRPEEVVIVRNGFFVREGGAAYSERLWLTAVSEDDLRFAVGVVKASGHTTFAVLDSRPGAVARLGSASLVSTTRTQVVGTDLYLHSYEFPGG